MSDIAIRKATEADIPAILKLGDEAVAWLVEQGRTGQWGTEPWSGRPEREATMVKRLSTTELSVAEIDGRVVGALAVAGNPHDHIEKADEPELYVHLLITSRAYAGRGVGSTLLAYARKRAREWGVSLMRVDCYAGDDQKLVAYYVGQGFTPSNTFMVKDWPGQILAYRLD